MKSSLLRKARRQLNCAPHGSVSRGLIVFCVFVWFLLDFDACFGVESIKNAEFCLKIVVITYCLNR